MVVPNLNPIMEALGLPQRLGSSFKKTISRGKNGENRIYTKTLEDGHIVEIQIDQGKGEHPAIGFNVEPPAGRPVDETPAVTKKIMATVEEAIKEDMNTYKPSAYVFNPSSASRRRTFVNRINRANSDYVLEEPKSGPYEGTYQMTYSPSVIKEIIQGLATTVPIAGLGAAAFNLFDEPK